jgi:hypothetical protein
MKLGIAHECTGYIESRILIQLRNISVISASVSYDGGSLDLAEDRKKVIGILKALDVTTQHRMCTYLQSFRVYVCMYVCMYVCIYVYMHVRKYVCICMYACM